MIEKPSLKETFKFWLKLGFISFGGPAGQIAIMHEYLVEKKKWISESKFLHSLNYCMVLPGPEAQQLATYIGWLLHGTLGGLAAGVLFVLPSMFILLGLSIIYVTLGNIPWIYSMFNGLKPAVVAIVILALIKIGKKSLLSPFHYIVGAFAFISIFFFNVPFPLIIVGAMVIAAMIRKFYPALFNSNSNKTSQKTFNEADYYLNKNSTVPGVGFSSFRLLKQVTIAFALWIMPLILFSLFSENFSFWKTLSLFFTQAALVTFGGAYAVLPYVAQVSVEKFYWLSNLQMLDGMALGETTPGPLIMVLAFVGFMAGYNQEHSLLMGTVGLVATTYFTFLPCFLFILAGAPIIEKTQENKPVKEILSVVTAAVVGVILNLTIYLGWTVLTSGSWSLASLDWVALVWIIISFFAMYRFKISIIQWIGISALFGWIHYLLISFF